MSGSRSSTSASSSFSSPSSRTVSTPPRAAKGEKKKEERKEAVLGEKIERAFSLNKKAELHYDTTGRYSVKKKEKEDKEEENEEKKDQKKLLLIDKYFYSKIRHKSYERDKDHGCDDNHSKELFTISEKNIPIIRQAINTIDPELKEKTDDELKTILDTAMRTNRQYYGDALSDDSDSEDEEKLKEEKNGSPRSQQFREIATLHTPGFWHTTKRETPQAAGLKNKIDKKQFNQSEDKNNPDEKTAAKIAEEGIKLLKINPWKRAKITTKLALTKQQEDFDCINNLIKTNKLTSQALKKIKTKFYFANYRGLNYMLDRWNADARRYHRKIDEKKLAQHSEMTLRTLPYSFYSELNEKNDYTTHPEYKVTLNITAQKIKKFVLKLRQSGPCVAHVDKGKQYPFLFNNIFEQSQHHFSNGINEFLNELQQLREAYPDSWGTHLPNAHNPAVATGNTPYHALKYAYGLKPYYKHPLRPRYHSDGTLEYSHAGKVYISLHSFEDYFGETQPSRVSQLDKAGRVEIDMRVAPEKETAYWGELPAEKVCYQYVVKYPSFKGEYKKIYEIKYGLDQALYESFQFLIKNTVPTMDTSTSAKDNRRQVIDLLSEWLCAYHEVLLIKIAKKKAEKNNAVLVYLNDEGLLSLTPDKGVFTRGEKNSPSRNTAHIQRNLRKMIASDLMKNSAEKEKKTEHKDYPGFRLYNRAVIKSKISSILQTNETLYQLGKETVTLSEEENNEIKNAGKKGAKTERGIRINKVRDAITLTMQANTLFSQTPNPVIFSSTLNTSSTTTTPSISAKD